MKEFFKTIFGGILLWVGVIVISIAGTMFDHYYWSYLLLLFVAVPLAAWLIRKKQLKNKSKSP